MLDMHVRPSEMIGIDDSYTAFCFDEACSLIISRIKEGDELLLEQKQAEVKRYSKPSDLYNQFDV